MKIRILFTGIGRRVELLQAFREGALTTDLDLKIYGADITMTAPALAYCDYTRIVPAISDESYIPTLLDLCETDRIDLVIPTIDTDLLLLAKNRTRFEEIGTKVLVSDPEMIRVCRDKNITSQFFLDCGLKTPVPVSDWAVYDQGFPAFIKPKDGSSSINAYKVCSIEELESRIGQVPDYIVQPFIDGTEYTVDIFCDYDGKPISIVPRIRLRVREGEVIKTKISMDDRIISECRAIIEKFKPRGPLTVQLIRDDRTDEDYFIEINPRFGGGSPLSMKAGSRSAESALRMLSEKKIEYHQRISDGAIYSRFDQSVCISNEERNIKGIIFDLDDTLYSEKEYIRSGYKAVSKFLGNDYEDRLWSYFEDGKPAIDELLAEIGRIDEKQQALEAYRSHKPKLSLYKDVYETIAQLIEQGIRVGIVTDGRPEGQINKIEALELDSLLGYDNIIITDKLGGIQFRKPCDIAFRIMQRRWRLPFEQMIYVGDNVNKDFQAPRQLGMECLLYDNQEGLYPNDGIESIKSIKNLKELKTRIG